MRARPQAEVRSFHLKLSSAERVGRGGGSPGTGEHPGGARTCSRDHQPLCMVCPQPSPQHSPFPLFFPQLEKPLEPYAWASTDALSSPTHLGLIPTAH